MIYLIYFILIAVCLFFIRKFLNRYKFPKTNALTVFTGGVKVGKSAVSLACAVSIYKRVYRKWKIRCFFQKLFKKPLSEEPLFYSNIPVATIKYCRLTVNHILRKRRFNFCSVVFVDEASLLCDARFRDDPELTKKLLLFFKLFGHETHGGQAIFNSQALSDLHISLRKCTSQYFFIHHVSRYIPFFTLCLMREERYSEDGSTLNTYENDVEDSLKKVIFRKRVFKMYDYCCYSSMTDDLPTENFFNFISKKERHKLKAKEIVSFREEFRNAFKESEMLLEESKKESLDNEKT